MADLANKAIKSPVKSENLKDKISKTTLKKTKKKQLQKTLNTSRRRKRN